MSVCGHELWEGGVFIAICNQPPDHPGWKILVNGFGQTEGAGRHASRLDGACTLLWADEPLMPPTWDAASLARGHWSLSRGHAT